MSTLKDEDFVEFFTYMDGMLGEALFLFCTRYNYGANFHDLFRPLPEHEYIYQGSIVRRHPISGLIYAEELFFVIDLDAMPSPLEIPPEVWTYALEMSPKSPRGFHIRPDVTVKVALMSKNLGLVLIAPVTLLLVLAQTQYPVSMIREGTIEGLGDVWAQTYGLLHECQKVRGGTGDKAPNGTISTLTIPLFFPLAAVDELLEVLGRTGFHPIRDYVEEVWMLVVPRYDRRQGKYANGNQFQWFPAYIRDKNTQDCIDEWAATPRIRRSTTFGESYFINLFHGPADRAPKTSWKTARFRFFDQDRLPRPNPVVLRVGQEFPVSEHPFAPIPTIMRNYEASSLQEFTAFYRDEFNRLLKVVEWHGPYLLLREYEVYDIARETKEGQDAWAKKVAAAKKEKAAKLAKEGKVPPEPGPGELEAPTGQPLVMSVQQQEEVRKFLKVLEDLWDRVNDLVDVRSKTGYTMKEMFGLFEELVRARAEVDRMAAAGYKMFEIDAAFYPAYDKFENFVTPRRMDEWYFGNVPQEKGSKTGTLGKDLANITRPIFRDIIVKCQSPEFPNVGHVAGAQSLLSLITKSGRPSRLFTIEPQNTIREERLEFLQAMVAGWFGKSLQDIVVLASQLLSLKEAGRVSVELLWGDVFDNEVVAGARDSPEAVQYLIARWYYNAAMGHYVALSEKELGLYKALLEKELGGRGSEINPVVEALEWLKLEQEQPETYKVLATDFAKIHEATPKSWSEEEAEKGEEEDEVEKDVKNLTDGKEDWEVIEEDDKRITYRLSDTSTLTDFTDKYKEAEEFARSLGFYDDDEDEDDHTIEGDEEEEDDEEEEGEAESEDDEEDGEAG